MEARPLREVPTRALYALHKGIERQTGLENEIFHGTGNEDCFVCALGAMGVSDMDAVSECIKYGLFRPGALMYGGANTVIGNIVENLNNYFDGTPEERREYMLRAIASELIARRKYVNPKPEKELVRRENDNIQIQVRGN